MALSLKSQIVSLKINLNEIRRVGQTVEIATIKSLELDQARLEVRVSKQAKNVVGIFKRNVKD